jgi:hypothetical protein
VGRRRGGSFFEARAGDVVADDGIARAAEVGFRRAHELGQERGPRFVRVRGEHGDVGAGGG